MANKNNSNLSFGLILLVIAVLFFVAGFLVSRLLNGGGDPTSDDIDIAQNETIRVTKTETIHVEHPVNIPSEAPQAVAQQPVAQQPVVQQPVVQQSSVTSLRVTPRNLDLQVIYDGIKYYFSVDEWKNLNSSVRSNCIKQGVVIDYKGVRFVVKLTMERHGSGYEWDNPIYFTWDEAKLWVNNMSGNWHLPTNAQGTAMAEQYEAVCSALTAFGGDQDPAQAYWTSTEYDSSRAWCFNLDYGSVTNVGKSGIFCVRAVRAI